MEPAAAGARERHVLAVSAETGAFYIHPWPTGAPITLGRGDQADLRIDERAVSRRHARLEVLSRDRFRVVDLGSANGTVVGGEVLRGASAEVGPGCPIAIGRTTLVVQVPEDSRPGARAPLSGLLVPAASRSPAMRRIAGLVERVAPTLINVLLLGETGAGKDGLAQLIHRASTRGDREFTRLNCAAFAAGVLESELFGHVKGAFTGATRDRPGLLEAAAGGTVFLDEIGEMPLELQAKLLVVLEERAVRRVGAARPVPIDARFISATNRDLAQEVRRGRFREDLYYRLNGFSLRAPALRERMEDLPALAEHFIEVACARIGRTRHPALGGAALEALRARSWPGNLRELRNAVEQAVLMSDGAELRPEDFQLQLDPPLELPAGSGGDERARTLRALAESGGNRSRAAKALGISRGTLQKRLDAYHIPRTRLPRATRDAAAAHPS